MTTYGGAAIHVERVGEGVLIEITMKADGMTRVIHFPSAEEAASFGTEVLRVATMTRSEFDLPDAAARCRDDDGPGSADWPMP